MRVSKSVFRSPRTTSRKSPNLHPANDLRRAYEYLGRIDILEGALAGSPFCDVSALAALAQQELAASHPREAANLLQAAEHLSFAALAPYAAGCAARIPAGLMAAVEAEFDHVTHRAEDYWTEAEAEDSSQRGTVATIYASALEEARRAYSSGAYRPALELARAAEALARATLHAAARESGHRLAC